MLSPFELILKNDLVQLTDFIEHGNVNIRDEKGRSLLCYAIKLHQNEAVKLLLKGYINLDLADEDGNTCYHYAVYHNRLGYLKMLLKHNGHPMKKNHLGQTPLYMACLYGRQTILDLYLEKYSLDIKEVDGRGETILIAMVRSGNMNLLKRFFTSSALEIPNIFGDTPLSLAVRLNQFDIAAFLVENGAFVHHRNHLLETPLFDAFRNKNRRMILLLIGHGACLDVQNFEQKRILDYVKSPSMKEMFVELKSQGKIRDYNKNYPLHYAILLGDEKLFINALELRYVGVVDDYGFTPLDLAMKCKNDKMLAAIKEMLKQAKLFELKKNKTSL